MSPSGHSASLHVSARADYGLRALLVLAQTYDEDPRRLVKGEFIAREQHIPVKFLEIILSKLRHADLVASQRGADGGYRLNRDPRLVSVAEVVRALDGPAPAQDRAANELHDYVGVGENVRDMWAALRECVTRTLETVTVFDIASGSIPELHLTK